MREKLRNMNNFKYLIIFFGIINHVLLIHSDELLELNCFNETQCKQFQHSDIKSSCIEEQCRCTTMNGESIKCQPMSSKVNNIIGGACPCNHLLNAECDKPQDVCYCASKFMPSSDKRRCIPKMVSLNEKCEQDSQCQEADVNAICNDSKCKCKDQFVDYEDKCVSIVGNKSVTGNDTQCLTQYGANAKYSHEYQYCICMPGHFASVDGSRCLKTAKYLENCTEKLQCMGTLGLGGECVKNMCQCSEKYFAEENETKETVCTAVAERGRYCRFDKDCYQRPLNETEPTMECIYGECNCKMGFNSYNGSECIKGSGASIKSRMGLPSVIAVIVFINKYYS